jgi:hypothetical protein
MPGNVEGIFSLVDRASGPARHIRTELRELQLQAEATGKSLDSVGGIRSQRTLDQTARETRTLGQEAKTTKGEVRSLGGEMKETRRHARGLGDELRTVGNTLRAVGTITRAMRWPAMIAGVGGLTQAVAGLAGGIATLIPGLIQAGGAAIGLVPIYGGLAGALGTTMLAFQGVSEAMGGNKEALKRLTPEARAFVETLKDAQKEMRGVQRVAQRELFPSLERSLSMLMRQRTAIREMVRQQAADTGNLAVFATRRVTEPGFMRELVALSDQSARAFGDVARGGVLFAQALVHVTRAAAPFTDWIGKTVFHLGQMAEKQAYVRSQTGELTAMFDRSRVRLEQFGRIAQDVFGAVTATMRGATGTGDDFWKQIERGADRWERWANSFRGQNEMRRFFNDLRPVVKETVLLVGALAQGLASIGRGPEGATMLRELRLAVPDLAEGIRTITSQLGPTVVGTLGDFVGLIAELAKQGGPLGAFVGVLGDAASAATDLLQAIGPLGHAIVYGLGAAMLMRRVDALQKLAGAIRNVGRASAETTGGGVSVPTGGGGGGAAPPAGGGGFPGGGAPPPAAGAMPVALAAPPAARGTFTGAPQAAAGTRSASGAFIMGPAPQDARRARIQSRRVAAGMAPTRGAVGYGSRLQGGWLAPRTPGRLATAVSGSGLVARSRAGLGTAGAALTAPGGGARFAGGAARTIGPTMLLMGLLQGAATQGGLGTRVQGGLSGLTLGIVPRPIGDDERSQNAAAIAQQDVGRLPEGMGTAATGFQTGRRGIRQIETMIQNAPGSDRLGEKNADPKTYTELLRSELKVRRQLLREAIDGNQQDLRDKSVAHARALMADFGRAFDIRSKREGPVKAMDDTVHGVLDKMREMNPAGRKVIGENVLAWARQQARHNPKLLGEVEDLEKGIKRSFSRTGKHVQIVNGQILVGSKSEWSAIHTAITTETEKARQEASADFTALQNQAVGSLVAMGFSRSDAKDLVAKIERGNKPGASASDKLTGQRAAGAATPGGAAAPKFNPGAATAGDFNTGDGLGAFIGEGTGLVGGFGGDVAQGRATKGAPNLMGADADLSGYVRDAARFGLHVTSGRRPGAITSYGNVSYHDSGDAVDIGNGRGPDAAKMRFARFMLSHYAPRLEELIYTPLGFSIKNGQKVPPIAASDHYDHVHVADTQGPGMKGGDGAVTVFGSDGASIMQQIDALKPPKSSQGGLLGAMVDQSNKLYAAGLTAKINEALAAQGGTFGADAPTGLGAGALTFEQVAQLAESVGLPGVTFAQIAKGESGFNPRAVGHDPGGTQGLGLWQITTGFNDDIIARFGGREAMFDPYTNALAAKAIYDRAGIGAWYGTRFMTGPNLHFHGEGEGAGSSIAQALATAIQQRPRQQGGLGAPQINAPLVSVTGPLVAVSGGDARQTAAIVRRELNGFAGMIVEEIRAMATSSAGAMG